MKKLNKICLILIMAFVLMLCNFVSPTFAMEPDNNIKNVVLEGAASEDSTPETQPEFLMPNADQLGPVVINDESGIPDGNFYQLLVNIFNKKYEKASNYTRQSQLRVNMLSFVEEINFANLRIVSITGLNKLNLPNLKKLNLGANTISVIKTEDLKYLYALEELYLYENNLSEIVVPTSLSRLSVLNLNANKLEKIDISGIRSGVVSLCFNKFTTISNITFPRKMVDTNLTVELFNNNIMDATEMYNNNGVLENGGKINVELGVQGIGLNYKTTDDEKDKITPIVSRDRAIKFYNVGEGYNFKVVIKNFNDNSVVSTLENNAEATITDLLLPVGEYKLEYVDKTTNQNLYNYFNAKNCAFREISLFSVIPKTPSVKFVIDGKEYSEYNEKLTSWNAKIVATNNEEDGDLYYSVSGGDWIKASEFKLTHVGGQYFVAFKVVNGNFSSSSVSRQVHMSQNPYVPDLFMMFLLGAVILIMFFVLIPIVVKKFVKD